LIDGEFRNTTIADVLFVPDLKLNLLSVRKLEMKGFVIVIGNGKAKNLERG
jgi:hypothetical protein